MSKKPYKLKRCFRGKIDDQELMEIYTKVYKSGGTFDDFVAQIPITKRTAQNRIRTIERNLVGFGVRIPMLPGYQPTYNLAKDESKTSQENIPDCATNAKN